MAWIGITNIFMEKEIRYTVFSFGKKSAARILPAVSVNDNKVRRGRGLLLAGSSIYPGAGILAARSAARMGCGYVTLAQPGISYSAVDHPDFLFCDLKLQKLDSIKFDAILVGPGFGVNDFTAQTLRDLKNKKIEKVVLDADAITVCAKENLFPLPANWIITPHSGELSRCLGITSDEIETDRLSAVRMAQQKLGCVVLLKGHHSLIASKKNIYRIKSGNSALAKAGTGDVLAGMITALRAQNLGPTQATVLAAYLHGACANLWVARGKDPLSMMASDVIEILPEVIFKVRKIKDLNIIQE